MTTRAPEKTRETGEKEACASCGARERTHAHPFKPDQRLCRECTLKLYRWPRSPRPNRRE